MRRSVSFLVAAAALASAVASAWGAAVAPAATLDVQRAEAIGTVSPRFLSFGVDISQMTERSSGNPYDFTRPGLMKLVAPLAPAYIRFSGTKIDSTYYDPTGTLGDDPPGAYRYVLGRDEWDDALAFSAAAGLDVNIGINAGPGPRNPDYSWNSGNAAELLQRAADDGHPPTVLSFGNEPNITYYGAENPGDYDAADYRADVEDFLDLKAAASPDSKFIGPGPFFSTGEERALFGAPFGPDVSAIMPLTGGAYDAISFHQYPAFGDSAKCLGLTPRLPDDRLSAEFLDRVDGSIAYMQAQRDANAPGKPLWVDEFGNTACGGVAGYSNTFAASFYYLNALGSMAAGGVEVASRWTISGPQPYALIDDATLTPRPDYWAALLWRDLMGTTVVRPRVEDGPETLRTFASCTPGAEDSVTTLALNTSDADPVTLDLVGPGADEGRIYEMTGELDAEQVALNGSALAVGGDGEPPELTSAPVSGGSVVLAPASYAFIVEPAAKAFACGGPMLPLDVKVDAPRQTLAAISRSGSIETHCTLDDGGRCDVEAKITSRLAKRIGIDNDGNERVRIARGRADLGAAGTAIVELRLGGAARRALSDGNWRGRFRTRIIASASAPDRLPAQASDRLRLQK